MYLAHHEIEIEPFIVRELIIGLSRPRVVEVKDDVDNSSEGGYVRCRQVQDAREKLRENDARVFGVVVFHCPSQLFT